MRNDRSPLTILLLIPFAFVGIGISVHAQQKSKHSSSIPKVGFCELTSHPERYANKVIRTEANYIVWWEGSYLYSDRCKDDDHKIHNNWDCSDNDQECQQRFSVEWQKLDPHMRSKRSDVNETSRVKAVFVGRLVGPGAYGHLDGFRYEFRITSVEKVSAIPHHVSWKDL